VAVRERWLSKRAISLHLAVLVFVPGCGVAAWWQITRAFDGNGLSYLYSIEWPIFAVLAAYFWWLFIHTDYENAGLKGTQKKLAAAATPATPSAPQVTPAAALAATADEGDPELVAYNARLAALAEQGPKTWRSPERTVVRHDA
jgi:hypothetical protein